jgi:putative GTP pyrophosphokinase
LSDDKTKKQSLEAHAKEAVSAYLRVQPYYSNLAGVIARIIKECLAHRKIKVHSVQDRAKEASSLENKAKIPSEVDPETPKYTDPLREINDLAGVRVITYFPDTLVEIDKLMEEEFDIVEKSNKGAALLEEERFGYQSIHYLVKLKSDRAKLAEYRSISDGVTEVQVRTILQHAWAEIEHDIQYKSSHTIPYEIRRRFMALAGMLEIADREFQAIQNADQQLETHAQAMVQRGNLIGLEITPIALKLFLDKRMGPDGRISEWSYDWTARLLKQLGFQDLNQVEVAIAPYDDHRLSVIAEGSRQGQTTRFEHQLLAAMGEAFIDRHPWKSPWFVTTRTQFLEKFKEQGIKIGNFDPKPAETAEQEAPC